MSRAIGFNNIRKRVNIYLDNRKAREEAAKIASVRPLVSNVQDIKFPAITSVNHEVVSKNTQSAGSKA